jgi:hypothetical protein
MTVPAWHVLAWGTVAVSPQRWPDIVQKLEHTSASFYLDSNDEHVKKGQVLWAAEDNNGPVGIAWDWAVLRDKLFVVSDPMHIQSNVFLTDDQGEPLDERAQLLWLNDVVHGLPWQQRLLQQTASWAA